MAEKRSSAEREGLVSFSCRLTARQGRWLDGKAIKRGVGAGEVLRAILEQVMERENAP